MDHSFFKLLAKLGAAGLLGFSLTGCSTLSFIFQATQGQLQILNRARPLEEVIQDPKTDPALALLLKKVPEFKKFGEEQGLKATRNYEEYVRLKHPWASTVVTVSQPLKFEPVIFKFPIVGSFNYLGWFDPNDAQEFARGYENQGLDVDIRGASAFSTLGWFRDPILSSMVLRHDATRGDQVEATAEPELLNVILHESVHATIYFKNQSPFNEAVASFIADVLTERYFENSKSDIYQQYSEQRKRSETVRKRFAEVYGKLDALYRSAESDVEKKRRKDEVLDQLKKDLSFSRRINNATLIQFKTYDPSDHGFMALWERCGKSLPEFLKRLKSIQPKDFESLGCMGQCEKFRGLIDRL